MDSIKQINELTKNDFISIFENVFEKSNWIAEKAYMHIPFANYDDLKNKFLEIFEKETQKNHIKVINSHPDLGIKENMTMDSKIEQSKSELNKCTKKEYEEFKILNESYMIKFGFPFIICISNMNKFEILDKFKNRIKNNKNTEFEETKKEIKKIAFLRLEKIYKK